MNMPGSGPSHGQNNFKKTSQNKPKEKAQRWEALTQIVNEVEEEDHNQLQQLLGGKDPILSLNLFYSPVINAVRDELLAKRSAQFLTNWGVLFDPVASRPTTHGDSFMWL